MRRKRRLYRHPAYRIAAGLFALGPLSALAAQGFPSLKGTQAVITICVSFVAPFLVIYSAIRSRPIMIGESLITFLFAMSLLILCYADIYQQSGLVMDTTTRPEAIPIRTRADAFYFSAVTWTTLGYGDLQPRGYCRLVAASEAVVGNIFLGSLIALLFSFLMTVKRRKNI